MRKSLIALINCLLLVALSYASNEDGKGSIAGKVTTSDGQPAVAVTVILKGTRRATITNEYGQFILRNVNEGNYELEVSLAGYQTVSQTVTLERNKLIRIDLQLAVSKKQLEEVVIVGGQNKFANKSTDYVARMPLSNLENPQVYSVVTKELLAEQIIFDPREAVRNVTGAAMANYPAGGFAITSRGFSTGINARNGMETVASRSSIDLGNIERIEVLKGPSGTLFGSTISSFGGVVNLVTKKPLEAFKGEVSYTTGSFGLNRLTADINTPLNKEKTALFRINVVGNRQNSFLDNGHNNNFLVAPSLSFKVNDRLTVLADAEFLGVDQTRITYVRVATTSGLTNPSQIHLPYRKALYMDDANARTFANKVFLEANYKMKNSWTSSTLFSFVSENAMQSYQYYPTWINADSVARNALIYGPIYNNYTNFQQNFNGKFTTGFLKHNMLLGASYRYYHGTFNYMTAISATKFIDTVDMTKTYTAVNKAKIDQFMLLYGKMAPSNISDQHTFSAYATDVVNLTDRLSAMLSLRVDRYDFKGVTGTDSYRQTSLSPKLGVVYQIVKDQVSLFGNYMSGFQNKQPLNQPNGDLFVPKPVYANQSEVGIKTEAFGKKLSLTASYYYINISNTIIQDDQKFNMQDGKQVSKGVEVEVIASPVQGLNVVAGYAYNDNRIVKTSFINKAIEGNQADGAPYNVANVWLSYKFHNKALNNLGVGFGGNYVGKGYLATTNTYYFPEYTVLNATIFYDQPTWRLGIKVNNLANRQYWDMVGAPQAPLNFAGNLTFKF